MTPVPQTNRVHSDDKLLPIRSAVIAAHLQLAGHAVVGVRFDQRQGRDVFYFERTAEPEFDRLLRALDVLRADAERVAGARR